MPATRHSASHRRHHSLLAWLVLLASLTPTFYAWWWIRRHLAQNNEGSFWAWVVLTAGLGVSTLLFSLLWLQDRRQRDLELANEALRRRDAEFVVLNAELERRIAERTAQLRLANEDLSRFKTIADATSDFINITDVEGRVLYMNPAGRRLIGAQPDEDVTQLCINDLIPQHTRELFEQVGFPAALRDGYWRGETDFRHRDGHLFPVSLVGIIVRTPDGRPLFMGCIARDVTEQRRMANELTAALAEERELNRLKSNFISMVTHEIRTPLSLILGSSEILSRYLDRLTAEKRAQHLQTIDSSVQRMSGLLEDVLLFSKAEAGRMEFNPIEMDLKQFCAQITGEWLSATNHRCPIELSCAIDAPARTDENLLRHILSNLISNAVKYSRPGSPVRLSVVREQGDAVFTVRDFGAGIPDEALKRLFTPFSRGKNVATIQGTGLGLAIVKHCAETHGGSIQIQSAESRGTTAQVRLPLFSPAHTAFLKRFSERKSL